MQYNRIVEMILNLSFSLMKQPSRCMNHYRKIRRKYDHMKEYASGLRKQWLQTPAMIENLVKFVPICRGGKACP